jgi:Mn-dependent DtxR family transcriptional regulator
MSVEHATPAEEEYLQIIYWLMEAELPITGANIARAMRLSPPTVHEMLGRLEADGYVRRDADRSLRFTDSGREQAEAIVGRHRLIERFLTDVVEVEVLRFENEAEDLLHYLKRAGLHPGLKGKLAQSGADEVVVESNGSAVSVTRSVAETVSVRARPSPPPRTALPEQLVLGKDRYGC